jgi:hypothetical protein
MVYLLKQNNMKVIALTYNYDLNKLSEIGRTWAGSVYGGKDFIFEYSAASYATFLDKNPNLVLHLYTDDVKFIKEKMSKYNVEQDRVIYYDFSPQLVKYNNGLKYSFDVLTDFIYFAKSSNEFTIKIDNDLIFNGPLPTPQENEVFVWKYERKISEGNPLMGEIKVAQETLGRTDIPIYNLGVLGLPVNYPEKELRKICNAMVCVDISSVTDLNTKIWHCCEQTANNWIFHKHNYKIVETHNVVSHHYDVKSKCIEQAKYLLK